MTPQTPIAPSSEIERRPGAVPPFRAWRKRLDLTIPEVGRLIDRSDAQIGSYEKMHNPPRNIRLAMLALEYLPTWRLADLGVTPNWRKPLHRRRERDPYP